MLPTASPTRDVSAPDHSIQPRTRISSRNVALPWALLLAMGAWTAMVSRAQDATWQSSPTIAGPVEDTFDFNAAANWVDEVTPGTALFGASSGTAISFSTEGAQNIGGMTFSSDAPAYQFHVGSQALLFTGTGISTGGATVTFENQGGIFFSGSATAGEATYNNATEESGILFNQTTSAGSATITGVGFVGFSGESTAGTASIANSNTLQFSDSASAGSATISGVGGGTILFEDDSTAADANITASRMMRFTNSATAGNANITVDTIGFAYLSFEGTSSAGNATITNIHGGIVFAGNSTAGTATLISDNEGSLIPTGIVFDHNSTAANATLLLSNNGFVAFTNEADGGQARFVMDATSEIKISDSTRTGGVNVGSIEGGGRVLLGANTLTVGSNNLSTEHSGEITGTGGKLVKTGTGMLILSGTNTYTGGTTVSGGTLQIGTADATGKIIGAVVNQAGLTFANADLSGLTSITTNAGGTTTFSGNMSASGPATLAINGGLVRFIDDSTAGSATITNQLSLPFSSVEFHDRSSAGSATISGSGNVKFYDTATAGSATITNDLASDFHDSSTAGSAEITSTGLVRFYGNSTAGSATITAEAPTVLVLSAVQFFDQATGGDARFILGANTQLDVSGVASSGITAGSIEGSGKVILGSKQLTVGSNDLSTSFDGDISGEGGGSLVKTGEGTLTLLGTNSFTAAGVEAGVLKMGTSTSLPQGIAWTINGGTLDLNQFTFAISSLSGTGGLLDATFAALYVDQTSNTTYAGNIIAYTFAKFGSGMLTLSGSSTLEMAARANGGTLTIAGSFTSDGMHIGENGFTGAVTVTGTLNAGSFLTVGDYSGGPTPGGDGTLTIGNGGRVTLSPGAQLTVGWTNATGTLNLESGGVLEIGGTNGIQKAASGTATINLSGGTIKVVNSDLTSSLPMSLSGNSTINTNGFGATLSGELSGSGGLTKTGAGTLALSGTNTYSGATTISAGTLDLGSGGSIANSAEITVAAGATLDVSAATNFTLGAEQTLSGSGTVEGSVISAGVISPGTGIGRLTLLGDLTLLESSEVLIEIAAANSFDTLVVNGLLAFGGTLRVRFLDHFLPDLDATFDLFDFDTLAVDTWFDDIVFDDPRFSGSIDYTTGVLGVTFIPEPATYTALAGTAILVLAAYRRLRRSRTA